MLSYGYVNFGLLNLEALTSQKGVSKQALINRSFKLKNFRLTGFNVCNYLSGLKIVPDILNFVCCTDDSDSIAGLDNRIAVWYQHCARVFN